MFNIPKPIPGAVLFNALRDKKCIIMACNTRIIPGAAKGIFRAAKELDAAVIMELAKTECNQHVGYSGLTPDTFSQKINQAADEVGCDIWALHADHTFVKKGDKEEMDDTKELISKQIKAGYTSFAIDASHLFNFNGANVREELQQNISVTIELVRYIKENIGDIDFGLEVEVGEIGRTDTKGMILTKPEEAVEYIKALNEAGIYPHVIAIANGSTHGNAYDENGNLIEQVSIDIKQTKAVAKALKKNEMKVRIAQHGITGTPLHLIAKKFPKGDIIKGNVATLWQNIAFDVIKERKPELYNKMFNWVLKNKPIEGKKPQEVFGTNGKYATKVFFNDIYALEKSIIDEIEAKTYETALEFFKAFNSQGTASIVRKFMKK